MLRNEVPTQDFTPKMGCDGSLFPTSAAGLGELCHQHCWVLWVEIFRGVGAKNTVISSGEAAWLLGEVRTGHPVTLGWKVQCQ